MSQRAYKRKLFHGYDGPMAKRTKGAVTLKLHGPVRRTMSSKYIQPGSGIEIKYVDTILSGNIGNSANQFATLINSVAAGPDDTERIGRKVTATSIQLHYRVAGSTTDLGSAQFPENADTVRVVLVQDKQPNGTACSYADVYNLVSAGATDPFAFRQMDNSQRFNVLAVDQLQLSSAGPNGAQNSRFIKCSIPVRYQGTSSGIANIVSGALWVFAVDQNTTTSNPITISGYARVTYTDD